MGEQPQTRRQLREAERKAKGASPIAIGLLALVVIAAAVFLGKSMFGAEPASGPQAGAPTAVTGPASSRPESTSAATPTESTPSSPATTTDDASTPSAPAVDPAAEAIAKCRAGWDAQTAAITTGNTALGLWDDHIEIMNRLQAGNISLKTAKAEWPATTKTAPQAVAAFRTADAAFTKLNASCAAPAGADANTAQALTACQASLTARNNQLAATRVAIKPWEIHLKDQSHFTAGEITPAAAEAAWRVKWREGQQSLPGWKAAVKAASGKNCTLPS